MFWGGHELAVPLSHAPPGDLDCPACRGTGPGPMNILNFSITLEPTSQETDDPSPPQSTTMAHAADPFVAPPCPSCAALSLPRRPLPSVEGSGLRGGGGPRQRWGGGPVSARVC